MKAGSVIKGHHALGKGVRVIHHRLKHVSHARRLIVAGLIIPSVALGVAVGSPAKTPSRPQSTTTTPATKAAALRAAAAASVTQYQQAKAKAVAAVAPAATPKLQVMAATTSRAGTGTSKCPAPSNAVNCAPQAGDQITQYKWLLNLDNTGNATSGTDVANTQPYAQNCHPIQQDPVTGKAKFNPDGSPVINTFYPDGSSGQQSVAPPPLYGTSVADGGGMFHLPDPTASPCPWPSLHYETASPVLSEGDEKDWNATTPLPAFDGAHGLPPGKYLATVTADGYQIGGVHFTICPTADDPINCPYPTAPATFATPQPQLGPGLVVAGLNPFPLPLATLKARAYADINPTSGAYQPVDPGLQGFHAKLKDYDGTVQVDYYGNPLCTEYNTDANGIIVLDAKGIPSKKTITPPATAYADGVIPGNCMTGKDGIVSIPNLVANRYAIELIPPGEQQGRVDSSLTKLQWVQNETLEGNHDIDAWLMADSTGLDTEQVVAGEPQTFINFGFVPGNLIALPQGTMGAGNVVTYSTMGLTDIDAAWLTNQWANTTVKSGDSSGVVASNTDTTITLKAPGWTPITPTAGQPYAIATGKAVTGGIKGQLMGSNNYVPGLNGIPGQGGNSGFSGIKLDRPLKQGWVALSDQQRTGDGQLVYSGPANPDGTFLISNVPDGDYTLTYWDQPQDYALDQNTVTISNGQVVDTGVLPLLIWFTRIQGHVYVDLNGNGRQDPGEPGVPNFVMQNLNRTNNMYEQGQNLAKTDLTGSYEFTEAYPLGQFTIEQFFNTRYKTTGVTYQACNDPQEHTIISPFVDLAFLPVIGQCARIDVGVQTYDSSKGDNGGIVATMLYDSIRVAYPARQQIQFDHLTGIPDFTMDLYDAVSGVPDPANPVGGKPTHFNADGSFNDANGYVHNADGSYRTGTASPLNKNGAAPVQSYITEHAGPPVNCVPQDANGKPVDNKLQNAVAVPTATYSPRCTESSLQGVGIGGGTDNSPVFNAPGAPTHGIQTVDGNYGLDATDTSLCAKDANGILITPVKFTQTPGCFQNHTGDFIVYANMPTDNILKGATAYDRPLFTASAEEDVNVFSGDQWVPQGANSTPVVWPPKADPPHQAPTGGQGAYAENPGTYAPGPDAQCAGALHTVHVTNPDLAAAGGSPFEGLDRNLCHAKLIRVNAGQSVAPNFHVHTVNDVPIPGKFSGYIVDDVSASTDRKSTNLGEVAGIKGAPVGFYDWTNTLQFTATSDYNGQYEALMPSTQNSNCLTPAGVCAQMYRLVGNDPGQPGTTNGLPSGPNPNYNPAFRTIAANFQDWPGQFLAADVAPTKAITNLEAAGAQFAYPPACKPALSTPQLYAVDRPYRMVTNNLQVGSGQSESNPTLTITGAGFGAAQGTAGSVNLGATSLPVVSWADQKITVTVPDSIAPGNYQLTVTNGGKLHSKSGLTYHVIGSTLTNGSYTPTILTVGPPTDARTKPPTPGVGASSPVVTSSASTTSYSVFLGQATATDTSLALTSNYAGALITAFATPANAANHVGTVGIVASNTSNSVVLTSAGWSNGTPANGTSFQIWPAQRTFLSIQDALETAAGTEGTEMPDPGLAIPGRNPIPQALVVVYPAAPSAFTPNGKYYENLIVHSPAKIQGVGPGGIAPGVAAVGTTPATPPTTVPGTLIDGAYFWSTNTLPDATGNNPAQDAGPGGPETGTNEPYAAAWLTLADNINEGGEAGLEPSGWDGNRNIVEGAVVYVVAKASGPHAYTNSYQGAVDGVAISGGDQKDFPGNINEAFGLKGSVTQEGGLTDEASGVVQTQGGGIFINAFANYFHVTNNLIQGNSGTYGGAIRVGTPYTNTEEANPNHIPNEEDGRDQINKDVVIANNQIIGNGGTNLAGAIGIFSGSIGYQITQNVICGNYSLEYGGGISHHGLSSVPSSGQPTYKPAVVVLGVIVSGPSVTDATMKMMTSGEMTGETITTLNALGQTTTGTVASNTATTVTLTKAGWSNGAPATPSAPSPNPFFIGVGRIDHNRILLNGANDEGGGILVGGELPVAGNAGGNTIIDGSTQGTLGGTPLPDRGISPGAGSVVLDSNMIASNIADDDGGGVRYLSAGAAPQMVTNNFITNNDSAHEGGGISIDDAPHVFVDHDTIARNVTTATAATSDGAPAPTGISTARNSDVLQRTLATSAPIFSNPTITSSVIWDNRAGSWATGGVVGIGLPGDITPINVWDVGTADGSGFLTVSHSMLDTPVNTVEGCNGCAQPGSPNSTGNWIGTDPAPAAGVDQCTRPDLYPQFARPFCTEVDVLQIRTYFRFKPSAIVSINVPTDPFGSYNRPAAPANGSTGVGAAIPGDIQ